MRVALVTALNGAGLERDCKLLGKFLTARGHEVQAFEFRGPLPGRVSPFDLTIFLEVFHERFLGLSERAWMVPNPEWWNGWHWNKHLDRFQLVLCKTRDCQRLFAPLVGSRAVFTGFLSDDRYDSTVERQHRVLHAPGISRAKGTAVVLKAWQPTGKPRKTLPLTVVGGAPIWGGLRMQGVTFCERLPEDEYRRLQNASLFHLCCSEYEGWGHYLHEALSVGAIVITTCAPPMSDVDGVACFVEPASYGKQRLARMSYVSPEGICAAMARVLTLSSGDIVRARDRARAAFLAARDDFAVRFEALLEGT